MAGIAGIVGGTGRRRKLERMMAHMAHRGRGGKGIIERKWAALGAVWPPPQPNAIMRRQGLVQDHIEQGRLARAQVVLDGVVLSRDPVGLGPLYYGRAEGGELCFASEVKALLQVTRQVRELPPGSSYDGRRVRPHARLRAGSPLDAPPGHIAAELRTRLTSAVQRRIKGHSLGVWLSGGLDSSAMAAIARPLVKTLHTFAGGLAGAPDLTQAKQVACFLGAQHHEVVVSFQGVLKALPQVIYALESFDALLVRSSVINFLVAQAASDHVEEVLSGEGSDELFAGYDYLKQLPADKLHDELLDITGRLGNTALQRVDRCAAAHGLVAHVCFLAEEVRDYALRIPAALKLRNGLEKWILRRAMAGALPQAILDRPKAKFWQGAGIGDRLAQHADAAISDPDFLRERRLPDGQLLRTKEELFYYRIFRDHFGDLDDLAWLGRTKGAPEAPRPAPA